MNVRFFVVLLLFVFSCKKNQQENNKEQNNKPLLSVSKDHSSTEKILPKYTNQIEDWQSLKSVAIFLERFKNASANEILSNALELKTLSKALKDSIKPTIFIQPSLNARINIFYNESLRLADMTYIPAIKADEVHTQANKVIDAFSSINSKVNTILRKKDFEDAIEIDVSYIGLDTTKIDSISKISITKELEEKPIKIKDDKSKKRKQK